MESWPEPRAGVMGSASPELRVTAPVLAPIQPLTSGVALSLHLS